eukprot:PITA_12382
MIERFEKWAIDFVGPTDPTSSNKNHILVCNDFVTKRVKAKVVSFATEKVIVDFLFNGNFTRFGTPKGIVSDNGLRFISDLVQEVMNQYKMRHKKSTSWNPQIRAVDHQIYYSGSVYILFLQQSFLGVKTKMSFTGLRLEYALEGSMNYIAWKDRMEALLDDNELKEFIETDVPKPTDATQADSWQKKTAKCRRILLEGVKDHIVFSLHGKATPYLM